MNIPYLVSAKLLISQRLVNYCRFWTPIRYIIRLASPLTTKKNNTNHSIWNLLLHKDDVQP
jgi:hypothetical protein